ncbi:4383_t:CDS:2, partial [Scutellospora calospora]
TLASKFDPHKPLDNNSLYLSQDLKEWKQPLLLLSWLLHPEYQMTKFKSNITNLNHVYFTNFPFDEQSISHFKKEIFQFWSWATPDAKELAFVAQRIFGICVNAASVEYNTNFTELSSSDNKFKSEDIEERVFNEGNVSEELVDEMGKNEYVAKFNDYIT